MKVYEYSGFHGGPAKCGLEIYRPKENQRVVILTEMQDNPGTSITNMFEVLATKIQAEYLPGDHPENVIWVEHYLSEAGIGRAESFDIVTLKIDSVHPRKAHQGVETARLDIDGAAVGHIEKVQFSNLQHSRPTWRRIPKSEVEKMMVNPVLV